MLDEANGNFINMVVTVIRYGVYLWLGFLALGAAMWIIGGLYTALMKACEAVGRAWDRSMGKFLP